MSDTILKKFLILFLLLNIALACAFNLFWTSKSVGISTEDVMSARNEKPKSRLESEAPTFHKSDAKSHRNSPSLPIKLQPENGDEIVRSTASEDEALDRLRDWAGNDPEAALKWGRGQANSTIRSEALTDACFQIAQNDPERALVLAERLNLNKDTVSGNLAKQWAAKDLTGACGWIMARPEGDRRAALVTGLTYIWSQTDPAEAARVVTQEIPPGSAQDQAVMMVLHQWATIDSAAARAWVEQFPENPLHDRSLLELDGIARYKQSTAQSQ